MQDVQCPKGEVVKAKAKMAKETRAIKTKARETKSHKIESVWITSPNCIICKPNIIYTTPTA